MTCGSTAVRGGGAEHDHQLLAEVAQELEDREAGEPQDAAEDDHHEEDDGQVVEDDEHPELLQRGDAVGADGVGDGAEDAEGGEPDDEADDLEEDFRHELDEVGHRLRPLADEAERRAEEHRQHQHLQDVAVGEGADEGRGDDVEQEADRAVDLLRALGVGRQRARVERARVDVHPVARAEGVGDDDAEDQRDRRHHLEVDDRLDADAADLLEVAGGGDAVHHDAEDERRDDHLDELDEAVAERLHLRGEVGPEDADDDAEDEGDHDLAEEGFGE